MRSCYVGGSARRLDACLQEAAEVLGADLTFRVSGVERTYRASPAQNPLRQVIVFAPGVIKEFQKCTSEINVKHSWEKQLPRGGTEMGSLTITLLKMLPLNLGRTRNAAYSGSIVGSGGRLQGTTFHVDWLVSTAVMGLVSCDSDGSALFWGITPAVN